MLAQSNLLAGASPPPSDSLMLTMQLSNTELRLLARAFTRPVFSELGRGHVPEIVAQAAEVVKASSASIAHVLQVAYENLRAAYRFEYVYKNEIASKIVFAKYSPRTASLVSEMRTGDSILDVAIFNGTSTAYEIKTEYDTLARLPEQLKDYLQVFDRVNVVTHPDGVQQVLNVAPDVVGVMALGRRGQLSVVRSASPNAASTDPAAIFRILRRQEYLEVLAKTHQWNGEVPTGRLYAEALRRFQELPPELAHELAVLELRKRTGSKEQIAFLRSLPLCLRTLGLSENLSATAKNRLLSTIQNSF